MSDRNQHKKNEGVFKKAGPASPKPLGRAERTEEYVSTAKGRERRWRHFSTLPAVHPDSQGGSSLGIISWIVFGLIAGVLAKIIMPGKDPGGMIITILIGISGAMVGGLISTYFGYGEVTGFNLPSFGIAVGGSFLLLFTYRILRGD